jgi:hypothetical protein
LIHETKTLCKRGGAPVKIYILIMLIGMIVTVSHLVSDETTAKRGGVLP